MTKCTFHKFGTSGEIEKHDAMCILPLNIGEARFLQRAVFANFEQRKNRNTVREIKLSYF